MVLIFSGLRFGFPAVQGEAGLHDRELGDRRNVGRPANIARLDLQQQMGHDGVARDHHIFQLIRFGIRTFQCLADQAVDGGQRHAAQLLNTVLLGADNSVDHIVTAGGLAVVTGGGRPHAAVSHIDQVNDDGRGADIDGEP